MDAQAECFGFLFQFGEQIAFGKHFRHAHHLGNLPRLIPTACRACGVDQDQSLSLSPH
jgi:hypothetical protein